MPAVPLCLDQSEVLESAFELMGRRRNVAVIGFAGSGKTTLCQAITQRVHSNGQHCCGVERRAAMPNALFEMPRGAGCFGNPLANRPFVVFRTSRSES
jgi:ABC-type branched-subunit amino acid transport system ATPase component